MSLPGKEIEFSYRAEDLECYPENGMRARVLNVTEDKFHSDDDGQVWVVTVDYTDFDSHNRAFESSNYYDKNGNPGLTARQAGFYKETEDLYLPAPAFHAPDEMWESYFVVLDPMRIRLAGKFKLQGNGRTYIQWLEDQVLMETESA
jgi:hypothetical protein